MLICMHELLSSEQTNFTAMYRYVHVWDMYIVVPVLWILYSEKVYINNFDRYMVASLVVGKPA